VAIVEEIIRRVDPAFSSAGYGIVAGAVLLERSMFLGLIIPGDVILALGGIYASRGDLGLGWVIAVGIAVAAAGESAGYALGRRYGASLVSRLPVVNRLSSRLDSAQQYFERNGGRTVAIGRFATAAGAFIPFVAGVARMPYPRFLLFDIPAIAVWAVGIASIGYVFGNNLPLVERILGRFGLIMLGVLIAIVLGRSLLKRRKRASQ